MSLKVSSDFAKKIAETLNWKMATVDDLFTFEEDKQGFFWARLKPKKFLDKPDFATLCRLVKDLSGEGYLQGARAWKIAGPLAKKQAPKSEESPNPIDEEMVETLRGSAPKIGYLYPILLDSFGNMIDGFHRRVANPNWPTYKVEAVSDPLQLAKARLIANERRDVPGDQKRALLDQIAKMTGWTPKQIAQDLGWQERRVYRYLSSDYKKPEPSQLAETHAASDSLSLNLKTQDLTEGKVREILDSPLGREVFNSILEEKGIPTKSFAEVEKKAAEEATKVRGLLADEIQTTDEEKDSLAHETPDEEQEAEQAVNEAQGHRHKIKGVQAGEFTCPECKQSFFIDHISATDHRLTLIKEVPE